jgi:PAS domain S-box-containing protein
VAPLIPLIVLSGHDDETTAMNAVKNGAQDYLIKEQVDDHTLARAIRYGIERNKAERRLQEAEKKYRTIFENSAVAIMMLDEKERLVSWNQFAEKLLGMNHDDLHLREVRSLYPETDWEAIRSYNLRGLGKELNIETRMIKKDGDIIDVDLSVSLLRDSGDNVTGSVGVIRDITEGKRMEEALHQSEERFRQVVEHAEEWIWEVDAHGLFTYISPVVERILGFDPDDMLGQMYFYDLFHLEHQEQLKKTAFEMFDGREAFREFETKNVDKRGNTVWLSKSGVPLYDENQQFIGYRGVDVDITERRRVHETLDRKQKNLESIFDAAPIGMLLVDEHIRIRRANDSIRNLAGKAYSDIINQPPGIALGCVHVADGPIPPSRCGQGQVCDECILFNSIQESITSDCSVHKKELQLTLDINGKRVQPVLSVSMEPVIIDGARFAVVALNDVTDRAKAEKELRETMEIKTQFISTVSHELRTPLASMKEAVLIVLDGVAGPTNRDQSHFLGLAKRNIDRLWRLINDVLDFQKLDAHKMEFIMVKGALGDIVEEAYDTMLFFANQRKVGLSLDVDPKLPHSVFDRDRMIQVLTNLMSNAIKFTPAEGQITIRLRHMNDELILSVIDEGMGIPPEAMDRIFDRFYRVSRPGQTIKGTGLGLAIVQQIIQAHGGRIEVESEVNKGTTFVTYLPVNEVEATQLLTEDADVILENTVVA